MRCIFKRLIVGGVFLLVVLSGCQNSPGDLFSPQSDIHVVGISPSLLQPAEASSDDAGDTGGGSSSTVEEPPTFPPLKVMFRITNGVSVFLEQYSVHYYTETGQLLAGGRFDHSGALAAFIQAPTINTLPEGGTSSSDSGGDSTSSSLRAQDAGGATDSGSFDGGQSVVSDVAGYVSLEVNSATVYGYMTRGNSSADDDITPVVARVVLSGRDINDKSVQISVQATISTTLFTSSS